MGYRKIENLYKHPDILMCYALEKIHGTSCHVKRKDGKFHYYCGGASPELFNALFDKPALEAKFNEMWPDQSTEVTVFGEGYGGKVLAMSHTYGPNLRFTAFEVQLDDYWLTVPKAEEIVKELGLEFVPYERGPLDIQWLDEQRDRPSRVAIYEDKPAEGIVIRPIVERVDKNGGRFIFKHKRKEFSEHSKPREVTLEELQIVEDAKAIADDWVTPMRLTHVLQKVPFSSNEDIGKIIQGMIKDIEEEGVGEVVMGKETRKQISKRTVEVLEEWKLANFA